MTRTPRNLTPEEKKLWHLAMKHVEPLSALAHRERDGVSRGEGISAQASQVSPHPNPPPKGEGKISLKGGGKIKQGSYAGVDRNTAERLRKGNYPIDATLDLHGMNRTKAQDALVEFIRRQYDKDRRALLVITGKGLRKNENEDRGILRELLPRWLADDILRPMLLAFDVAKPKHGGTGAFYILLKRKRT